MTDRELIAQAEAQGAALIDRAISVLQDWIVPDSGMTAEDALSQLLGIFDGPEQRTYHALRAQAQAEQPAEPVAPVLIALAWSKARNAWMQASRHGTQEAADLLAIAELTHYLERPDPRIAALTGLLRDIQKRLEMDDEMWLRIEAALGGK